DTRMFMDILMTNRTAVLAQLESFAGQVDQLRKLLTDGDEAALREKLAISQVKRSGWKKA
ncbi:MAG: hypothetical protein KDE58_07700, partial [Caldilineaceae bacterium]|nr:hypothetical protein [Caldilineaceae bacterium]